MGNQGILSDIKVLDFTYLLPGPFCSLYLADLGAEVVKVEHPIAFDGIRKMGPFFPNSEITTYHYLLNRNKKSIAINYKKKEGVEIIKKLIPHFDIFLEGFRPGMMEEIGLGYEEVNKINPEIIYCSISGYGENSRKDFAGHDANYLSFSGVLDLIGENKPVLPAIQIADILGGSLHALIGILTALYARTKSNRGDYIHISMHQASLSVAILSIGDYLANHQNPIRNQTYLSGLLPNYQIYETKDNRYIVVAALEGQFFHIFLKQIQREDLWEEALKKNFNFVKQELKNYFQSRNLKELEFLFQNPNTCVSPILTIKEVFEDPLSVKDQLVIEINDNKLGLIKIPNFPLQFKRNKIYIKTNSPELGQHTYEILNRYSFNDDRINELSSKKIIKIN